LASAFQSWTPKNIANVNAIVSKLPLTILIHFSSFKYLKEEKLINIVKGSLLTIALTLAMFFGVQDWKAEAKSRFISIGTGGPTGVYFVVGNAVCRMVHREAAEGRKKGRKHGIRCSAPSTGGSNYNIGQIKEGELQFGVAQSDWQHHAYNGSSKWKGKQYSNLRAVFSVHPEPFPLIARKLLYCLPFHLELPLYAWCCQSD
jgi:hypothetical protein